MSITYKVLGQANPAATTDTTVYTVPAASSAVVSTIAVCNQTSTPATYRISVVPSGQSLAAKNYIVYDSGIIANSTTTYTIGVGLATGDTIHVYSSSTTLSFSVFGTEQ
jgi:hypothetical protein